jgi:hypothetical protein
MKKETLPIIQKSMIASLILYSGYNHRSGGFQIYSNALHWWCPNKFKTKELAITAIKEMGFGAYEFEGKIVKLK